jgi:hypothetical protein
LIRRKGTGHEGENEKRTESKGKGQEGGQMIVNNHDGEIMGERKEREINY